MGMYGKDYAWILLGVHDDNTYTKWSFSGPDKVGAFRKFFNQLFPESQIPCSLHELYLVLDYVIVLDRFNSLVTKDESDFGLVSINWLVGSNWVQ